MTETKKLYYSISEVSKRLGVKPHVLRYWETQFRWLRPKKNRAGNRSYQEKDLVLLEQIRELLYDRRFTIEGARKEIDRIRAGGAPSTGMSPESGGDASEGSGSGSGPGSGSGAGPGSAATAAATHGKGGAATDAATGAASAAATRVSDAATATGSASPSSGSSPHGPNASSSNAAGPGGSATAAAVPAGLNTTSPGSAGPGNGPAGAGGNTPEVVVKTEVKTGADPEQIGELRAELLGLKQWLESRS